MQGELVPLGRIEQRVLELYKQGLAYKQIAERLGSDVKSVENALQRARIKGHVVLRNQRHRECPHCGENLYVLRAEAAR